MELAELEAFVMIADLGTFTAAARALGVSQPAISRRIDLLEGEVESLLFERDRAGARLTEAGAAFLPFAEQALASVRDGTGAVRDTGQGPIGAMTLALVGTLASTSLIDRVALFRHAYPQARLLLRTQTSDGVSRLVQRGDASMGLRYYPASPTLLESVHVWSERMVVIAAAHSRLIVGEPTDAGALVGIPWVTYPIGTGSSGEPFARAMEHQLARLGLAAVERIEIDSLTAQKRMVEADFGLGLVPRSAVTEELQVGSLTVVDLPELEMVVPVYLVRRVRGYESAGTRALARMLASATPGTV